MAKFSYTVTNTEGKKISGVIAADTLELARDNLLKLGYKIELLLPDMAGPSKKIAKHIFAFEARNKQGKKIVGTISTSSEAAAKKKLTEEHQLTIQKLEELKSKEEPPKADNIILYKEEAQLVIDKAEKLLETMSIYDAEYNQVFDAKEELRQMLKNNQTNKLAEKMTAVLQLLQQQETSYLEEEKKEEKTTVLKRTEDMMSSIRLEAEGTAKSPANFYLNTVLREIMPLTSWLLLFYAVYFVIVELSVSKHFTLLGNVFFQNTLSSSLLFKISLFVLLWHVVARIKLYWAEKSLSSGILLVVLSLLVSMWIFLL